MISWKLLKILFLRANIFSGKEITSQAWYGTPESIINGNQEEILAYADRNYIYGSDRENLLTSGRKYNYYTYQNEIDNYQQDHYQLHFNHLFNSFLKLSSALHYTRGKGYYEQYKEDEDFNDYGEDGCTDAFEDGNGGCQESVNDGEDGCADPFEDGEGGCLDSPDPNYIPGDPNGDNDYNSDNYLPFVRIYLLKKNKISLNIYRNDQNKRQINNRIKLNIGDS